MATRQGAGYIRLSQLRPGDTTLAPETQRNIISDWASAQDCEIVAWYSDLDVSGKDTDRPELGKLRDEWSRYDFVAAAKIDRWARSVRDFTTLIGEAESAGVALVAVRDNLDLSTPIGKFVAIILAAFAEMELAVITQRIRDGKQTARAEGRWNGGTVPYGMRVVDHKLTARADECEVIRETLMRLQAGVSLNAVTALWREQMKPRNGGKGWRAVTVKRALLNPRLVPDVLSATERAWLLENFEPGDAPTRVKHLLAGLLVCTGCGYLMHRATTGYQDVYRCSASVVGIKCPHQMTIKAPNLERFVSAAYLAARGAADETYGAPLADEHAEKLATLDAERRMLRTRLPAMSTGDMQAAVAELVRLDAAHAELSAARPAPALVLRTTGRTMAQVWDESDTLERRRLLSDWLTEKVAIRSAGGRGRWVPIPDRVDNPFAMAPRWTDEDTTEDEVRDWLTSVWATV